ncbi:MAG: hypothetical protein VYB54_05210, partial [Pseudomonadota bacterium]|nr:hypothetical protein [Pseudomonadota bacterium]
TLTAVIRRATPPPVDATPLPLPQTLTAVIRRATPPPVDATPLPLPQTLTATIRRATPPPVDATPLPLPQTLTATIRRAPPPVGDELVACTGDDCFEVVGVTMDSVRVISGFNAFDSAQVEQLEDVQAFRNADGGGNGLGGDNGGGGDVDLNTLVPGGTFVAAQGGFYAVSIQCNDNNATPDVLADQLSAAFDFGFANFQGTNDSQPLARFVTFNGDVNARSFTFADNVATAFTVEDVRDLSAVATGTVAANSTGVIFDVTCFASIF